MLAYFVLVVTRAPSALRLFTETTTEPSGFFVTAGPPSILRSPVVARAFGLGLGTLRAEVVFGDELVCLEEGGRPKLSLFAKLLARDRSSVEDLL